MLLGKEVSQRLVLEWIALKQSFVNPIPDDGLCYWSAIVKNVEQQIESCEHCHPADAEIPFDWLLAEMSMANYSSRGSWRLVQTATVFLPRVTFEADPFGFRSRNWRLIFQRPVNPKLVVVILEIRKFHLQICRRPKQKMVESFSTNGSD